MTQQAATVGIEHLGLSVPNLAETKAFFIDTLGFTQVGEMPAYPGVALSDGTARITLWQIANGSTAAPFDRKKVTGLHHVAFKIASLEALDSLHDKLRSTDGVTIEFAPEDLGPGPTKHMMCTIPGGIRVEFMVRLT